MKSFEELYNSYAVMRILYWIAVNLTAAPIVLALLLARPFRQIKLFPIVDERIGHEAANTDLFLRRIQLGMIKSRGIIFIGIATTRPVNAQLLKMFSRRFRIIQLPISRRMLPFFRSIFSKKSILGKTGVLQENENSVHNFKEFADTPPNISFTKEEEEKGGKLLRRMGVKENGWFVCFHARDPEYLAKKLPAGFDVYNYRDCNIRNFLKAAEYIAAKGGFAVRMGIVGNERLPRTKNKRIIDYAANYRNDFMDIYLPAKCKFFIGSTAGLWRVPTLFNVPIAGTNFAPFHTPLRKDDLFIPKKLWSKEEKRFLTFSELFDFELSFNRYPKDSDYEKAGLAYVENSPEEILDLAKEMNEKLDGKWKETKEDKKLQEIFRSLIRREHPWYGTPARLGAIFLRKNKNLLK